MKEQFTQGEWINEGTTVYALQDSVWLGKPSKENRFQFSIQGKCSDEELLANAVLAKVAPKMYRKLKEIAISMECCHGVDTDEIFELLAEARGETT